MHSYRRRWLLPPRRLDMWGVGGAGADMMERSAMNSAQGLASQVDMLLNQARRFLPDIRQFPSLQVAKA